MAARKGGPEGPRAPPGEGRGEGSEAPRVSRRRGAPEGAEGTRGAAPRPVGRGLTPHHTAGWGLWRGEAPLPRQPWVGGAEAPGETNFPKSRIIRKLLFIGESGV